MHPLDPLDLLDLLGLQQWMLCRWGQSVQWGQWDQSGQPHLADPLDQEPPNPHHRHRLGRSGQGRSSPPPWGRSDPWGQSGQARWTPVRLGRQAR